MQNTFGQFLKEKRQDKNITQKDLAKMLYVTESAVSKWENDVAHPDITLLPKLSEILGVTEHELITASVDTASRKEKSQAKKWRTFTKTWNIFFYIAYGLALLSCFICNLAINNTLSWFWIVFTSLLLSFTFTNLPSLINKYKLILIPLSNLISLLILLATCAIYTNGKWFIIASISILLGFAIIFIPIYINKYSTFNKIKRYSDFISLGIDFIILNLLLITADFYTLSNDITISHWYFKLVLPIVLGIYIILNMLLCIKFLKSNRLIKSGIILLIIDIILYVPTMFIKDDPMIPQDFHDLNILNSNLSNWNRYSIEPNVHLIIFLTILITGLSLLMTGLFRQKKKHQ